MPAAWRRAHVVTQPCEQPEPTQEHVTEGRHEDEAYTDDDRKRHRQMHGQLVQADRDEVKDSDRGSDVHGCAPERRRLEPWKAKMDPQRQKANSGECARHEELVPHGMVIGSRRGVLEVRKPLNFRGPDADSSAMKIKRFSKTFADDQAAAQPLASVQAFLTVSLDARKSLEPAVVRDRVVQDPLGALRERLAAG
jgi:hypothetical protein